MEGFILEVLTCSNYKKKKRFFMFLVTLCKNVLKVPCFARFASPPMFTPMCLFCSTHPPERRKVHHLLILEICSLLCHKGTNTPLRSVYLQIHFLSIWCIRKHSNSFCMTLKAGVKLSQVLPQLSQLESRKRNKVLKISIKWDFKKKKKM